MASKANGGAGDSPSRSKETSSERASTTTSLCFSSSWPSVSLQKQLPCSRMAQSSSKNTPEVPEGGAEGLSAALSHTCGHTGQTLLQRRHGETSLCLLLCFPPEAIRILQHWSLEKQQPQGQVAHSQDHFLPHPAPSLHATSNGKVEAHLLLHGLSSGTHG